MVVKVYRKDKSPIKRSDQCGKLKHSAQVYDKLVSKIPESLDVKLEDDADNNNKREARPVEWIIDEINCRAMDEAISVFSKGESERLSHQNGLIKSVGRLTILQLIFFNVIVVIALIGSFVKGSPDIIKELFTILKYYIGATVVELIGMIAFITRGTFSSDHIKVMKMLFSPRSSVDHDSSGREIKQLAN